MAPLPSHNFIVEISQVSIPFSKVQSIEVGIETDALAEGGESRFVYSLAKPDNAEKVLSMERTVLPGKVAQAPLRVGTAYKNIVISVLDRQRRRKKMYMASHVILKKRKLSELDAINGNVFVENLEFIYRELTEIII
jgi:phage tail-like protein